MREKQIDAPIQKIWFRGYLSGSFLEDTTNPGKTLVESLNIVKISIQKQTKNGNIPLLLPIGLGSVAEICSNQEGHINAVSSRDPQGITVEGCIELSSEGAISSSDGKFLLLSLEYQQEKNWDIELYGIEFPVITNSYTQYKQLKVNANTQKTISLIGKDVLALPRDNFQQIDIVFSDRTVTFKEDIKVITQAIENLVANVVVIHAADDNLPSVPLHSSQSYYDGLLYHTIGIRGAIEAKVLYSADSTVITTETVNI